MGAIRDAMGFYVRGTELWKSRWRWGVATLFFAALAWLFWKGWWNLPHPGWEVSRAAWFLSLFPLWHCGAKTFYNRAATINSQQHGQTKFATIFDMWKAGMLDMRRGETRPALGHPNKVKLTAKGYTRTTKKGYTLRCGSKAHEKNYFTIGPTGCGKTDRLIIPAMRARRSMIVVDPKGEVAATTAPMRARMGATEDDPDGLDSIVMLNPGQLHVDGRTWMQSDGYNPLSLIDAPQAYGPSNQIVPVPRHFVSRCVDQATAINHRNSAPTGSETHWYDGQVALTAAAIMYVCATKPPDQRTYGEVRELLSGGVDRVRAMALDARARGVQEIRNKLESFVFREGKPTTEISNLVSGAKTACEFIDIADYRDDLARHKTYQNRSQFRFRDMKERLMTAYLVLHPDELALTKGGKWGRMILQEALSECMLAQTRNRRTPSVLMVWDEFPAFGYMAAVQRNANLVRSYGLNFWWVAQNINQLQDIYGRGGWDSLESTCGTITAFQAGDMQTAYHLSAMTGEQTQIVRAENMHKQPDHDSHGLHIEGFRLYSPDIIRRHLGRDTAIVFCDDLDGPAEVHTTSAREQAWSRELEPNPYYG